MTPRPVVILGIAIIATAVVAAAGYAMRDVSGRGGLTGVENDLAGGTPLPEVSGAPAAAAADYGQAAPPAGAESSSAASSSFDALLPEASSTPGTDSWLMYVDNAAGYSLEYPPDMAENASGGTLSLVFPKNIYFHWPLLDDAKVTVAAYAASSCPAVSGSPQGHPEQFDLDGLHFTRSIGVGAGAGQLYTEAAYDTEGNGKCYRLDFLDHGTDGAGFYVNDASLAAKYDARHAADMAAVFGVMNGMVGSLKILSN